MYIYICIYIYHTVSTSPRIISTVHELELARTCYENKISYIKSKYQSPSHGYILAFNRYYWLRKPLLSDV